MQRRDYLGDLGADEDNIKMNLEYTELEASDCNWFMIETTLASDCEHGDVIWIPLKIINFIAR